MISKNIGDCGEYAPEFGFFNEDCMEGMKRYPDNFFDLAIVDPPYGSGVELSDNLGGGNVESVRRSVRQVQRTGGTWAEKYAKKIVAWDVAPPEEYFEELFRVSRNQIIWGGNYFRLPPTRCFLIWRKLSISEGFSMAMAEYGWTSFNENAKVFECAPQDSTGTRFHPTQKPVALYKWILNKYAKEGDIILDTHVGSASSLIACHETGHKFVGFEIDPVYYEKAKKRLDAEMAQTTIFDFLKGE